MCCNTFSVKYVLRSNANVSCSRPGVPALTLAPDRDSTISIRTHQVNGCKVCSGSGPSQQCSTYLEVRDNAPARVSFDCRRPEDVFHVEVTRNIGESGRGQRAVAGRVRFIALTL